jgi:putative transcriptional regulator
MTARTTDHAHGRSDDDGDPGHDRGNPAAIRICLDELLSERSMTLTELSERVGITVVNLSVLKNGRARAIRFSTLAALCAELGCQPGDLLRYEPGMARSETPARGVPLSRTVPGPPIA